MTTILSWVIWYLAIAAVLTVGAMAWERSARWSGAPARWGWLLALGGSAALPWLLRRLPEAAWTGTVPAALPLVRLDAVVVATGANGPSGVDIAEALWLAASVGMIMYVGVLLVHVLRTSRRWRVMQVDGGAPVLVSGRVGPGVLGVRRSVVVLPEWALDLDEELRELLLRHERSHADAGDPRVLLAGLALVAAMPWNPLMWVQLLRLRNAIELDCDARVLAGGADPGRYGTLLLEVGRRRSRHALVMATFAAPRMLLAQRIGRIAQWPPERRQGRALAYAGAAVLSLGAALSCADPARISDATREPRDIVGLPDPPRAPAVADSSRPHFTPMTVAPELLNREQIGQALERAYPPLLRDAGIGGSPTVFLFVDEKGSVHGIRMSRSSGYAALDTAALAVARLMRFEPALNRDRHVAVWIELPITFKPTPGTRLDRDVVHAVPASRPDGIPPPAPATPREPSGDPPRLLNRGETERAIVASYPPLLREANIGGSPTVHFYIDTAGAVQAIEPGKRSGYPALDEAALAVARVMRFSPAEKDGRKVGMWVEIPIVFTAK